MRLFLALLVAVAVVVLLVGPTTAQDKGGSGDGLKPDLPLEKPVPEMPPEEEEDPEEPPEENEEPPEENEEPPEEEPENPPPEFFEEPIEEAEVIFVIDRTGSMRWPSKMSVVDEGGNPVNNAAKYDVARIELIKAIQELADNMKFGVVGFSTGGWMQLSGDSRWVNGGSGIGGRWTAWPPASGEPAPIGYHARNSTNVPIWPATGKIVPANASNKAAAISWSQGRLSNAEVSGGTCTYEGMSAALKMVSKAPPGVGPGGEPKKSATGIYLLTDGAPTHIGTVAYALCRVYGSYDAGQVYNDGTWTLSCMALTKSKILAENTQRATIYTLGIGMDMSHQNAHVWNPGSMNWDIYPTQYNNHTRSFLTQLAEATGGHYREVSK